MKETRAIKFYLDESVNNVKKENILKFLKECQDVENQLLEYYWNNFDIILKSNSQIDFNYKNNIKCKDIIPRLKSHHYQQVLQKVYTTYKSIQSNINNKLHFKFNDKDKQRIYNYCKGFCFDWDNMNKYINAQLKKYKNKDNVYYDFIVLVKEYISKEENYNELKKNIEDKFWEIKSTHKLPHKKEFQILCNTFHSVDIELKEFQWVFTIDNNDIIGGTPKRTIFDKIIIPVKFSNYHKKILDGKTLANTFNLKLNRYNKIEIIGVYELEIEYPKPNPTDIIGIDIGLNKLISCSDGEIVEQNSEIVRRLKQLHKRKYNRIRLQKHLQEKYNDEELELNNNRYLRQEIRMTNFITTDNRYKIKQFLRGREQDHIIMEDIKIGYSDLNMDTNYLMRRMHIQQIKDDMLKYCKKKGIKISLINPAYTSQQCPICNHISKDNRKTQETFFCVKCGHADNADHNASINIMNRYYEDKIKLHTPNWRIKEILGQNI